MAYFLQLVFAGAAQGCIYALIGLGFSIIFKASQVINFAQGELLLVGTYVVASAALNWHLPFLLALPLGLLVTIVIGLLFERLVLRRMIGRPPFTVLMITIGLDIILRTLVIVGWGSRTIPAATPFAVTSGFNVAGVHLGSSDLWTIGVTIVLCAALYYFFRHTRYGLAMRATALDQEAALAMGIDVRNVYALAWGLAAAITTLGGLLLAIDSLAIDPNFGNAALVAFPAIILGGLDSVSGAVIGGVIIGLTSVLTAGYENRLPAVVGTGLHEVTPYLIMILILMIRPYGLFGSRKVERI
jgi:branched-chain amino acid transport system permease protein